jgi:hypothetical protein
MTRMSNRPKSAFPRAAADGHSPAAKAAETERHAREAEALRANLAKRKAQSRAREEPSSPNAATAE